MFLRSMVRLRDIKDGASCTYLAGEKYMMPDAYMPMRPGDPVDMGSDQSWDHGNDYDVSRFTRFLVAGDHGGPYYYPPSQDRAGEANPKNVQGLFVFGSAHANSFNMVMCDGSVQQIPYSIDPVIHDYLGGRADGHVVDLNKLY